MRRYAQSTGSYLIFYVLIFIFSTTMLLSAERDHIIQEGLDSIRNGRFSKALESFTTLIKSDPSSPDGYFFISLSYFIHLIYSPEKRQALEEFEKNLKESISKGKAKIKSGQEDDETLLFLGTSYLLKSYYKALQKEYFRSAYLAKKGKKILEKILKKNPELYDAYFGLGIFNYYADKVPSLIKRFRFLFFLPGGDRAKGLSQLSLSSSKAKYFHVESSLLLAEIHSSKHERNYYAAYRELSNLIDSNQEYLLILHAIARLEMKILNYYRASNILLKALKEARKEDIDGNIVRLMRLHLIQCYFNTFRMNKAIPLLEDLFKQSEEMPDSMAEKTYLMALQSLGIMDKMDQWEEWKHLYPHMSSRFAHSIKEEVYFEESRCNFLAYVRASKAAEEGDFQTALMTLDDISLPCRKDEQWILLKGEMSLRSGNAEQALEILMPILQMGPHGSAQIRSVGELRAGNCFDVMGKRSMALQYYERLANRPSPAREAAYYYLKTPFDLNSYFPYREH